MPDDGASRFRKPRRLLRSTAARTLPELWRRIAIVIDPFALCECIDHVHHCRCWHAHY